MAKRVLVRLKDSGAKSQIKCTSGKKTVGRSLESNALGDEGVLTRLLRTARWNVQFYAWIGRSRSFYRLLVPEGTFNIYLALAQGCTKPGLHLARELILLDSLLFIHSMLSLV